jgi:hypothetical protein
MMKTLTESLKLIQEHIDLQMYGHAWDKCQEVIDAVNSQNSSPVWQGLDAKEIASIPINEYTVQTVEKILKEKNT